MSIYKQKYPLFILLIAITVVITIPTTHVKSNQQNTPLKVVVSLSMIQEWAQGIGGTKINVTSIVTGLENPHTYDPDPSEIAAVVGADLFIRFGLEGLEPWVQSIIDANPSLSGKILTLIDTASGEYMEYDPLIGALNPHVWMSPIKARDMSNKIYEKISLLDPENNDSYFSNFLFYQNNLFDLLIRIDKAKPDLKGVKVVVQHPSFMYFLDLLGIERIGSIEEHEGSEPSAAHIAEITEKIKEAGSEKVLIISQPQYEKDNVLGISEETGAQIVELTPLLGIEVEKDLISEFGEFIDSYFELFDYNLYKLRHPLGNGSAISTNGKDTIPGFSFIEVFFIITTSGFIIRKKRRTER